MSHPERSSRKLLVEISEKQFRDLERLIPYGLKAALFRTIIDDITEILEGENPRLVIGAWINNKVQYNITMQRRDKSATHRPKDFDYRPSQGESNAFGSGEKETEDDL